VLGRTDLLEGEGLDRTRAADAPSAFGALIWQRTSHPGQYLRKSSGSRGKICATNFEQSQPHQSPGRTRSLMPSSSWFGRLAGSFEDSQRSSLALFRKGEGRVRDQKLSSKVHCKLSRSPLRTEKSTSNRYEQPGSFRIRSVARSARIRLLAITDTPSPCPLPRRNEGEGPNFKPFSPSERLQLRVTGWRWTEGTRSLYIRWSTMRVGLTMTIPVGVPN